MALSLREIMKRGATVTGSMLRPRSVAQKGAIADELHAKVWPLLESRKVRVVIDSTFPLGKAADAHERLECGEHIGKIVLRAT